VGHHTSDRTALWLLQDGQHRCVADKARLDQLTRQPQNQTRPGLLQSSPRHFQALTQECKLCALLPSARPHMHTRRRIRLQARPSVRTPRGSCQPHSTAPPPYLLLLCQQCLLCEEAAAPGQQQHHHHQQYHHLMCVGVAQGDLTGQPQQHHHHLLLLLLVVAAQDLLVMVAAAVEPAPARPAAAAAVLLLLLRLLLWACLVVVLH